MNKKSAVEEAVSYIYGLLHFELQIRKTLIMMLGEKFGFYYTCYVIFHLIMKIHENIKNLRPPFSIFYVVCSRCDLNAGTHRGLGCDHLIWALAAATIFHGIPCFLIEDNAEEKDKRTLGLDNRGEGMQNKAESFSQCCFRAN